MVKKSSILLNSWSFDLDCFRRWQRPKNDELKNIIVLDSNLDVANYIKQGLESLYPSKYHVIFVSSGKKLFEYLEKNDIVPDMILLEISLPDTNGWEVFDKLRCSTYWKSIPIVFISSRKDKIARRAGHFLGSDFIQKPIEISNLEKRIEMVLNQD